MCARAHKHVQTEMCFFATTCKLWYQYSTYWSKVFVSVSLAHMWSLTYAFDIHFKFIMLMMHYRRLYGSNHLLLIVFDWIFGFDHFPWTLWWLNTTIFYSAYFACRMHAFSLSNALFIISLKGFYVCEPCLIVSSEPWTFPVHSGGNLFFW